MQTRLFASTIVRLSSPSSLLPVTAVARNFTTTRAALLSTFVNHRTMATTSNDNSDSSAQQQQFRIWTSRVARYWHFLRSLLGGGLKSTRKRAIVARAVCTPASDDRRTTSRSSVSVLRTSWIHSSGSRVFHCLAIIRHDFITFFFFFFSVLAWLDRSVTQRNIRQSNLNWQRFVSRLSLLQNTHARYKIQSTLLDLGSHIATPRSTSKEYRLKKTRFVASVTTELEQAIDAMDEQLPPLKNFVLPVITNSMRMLLRCSNKSSRIYCNCSRAASWAHIFTSVDLSRADWRSVTGRRLLFARCWLDLNMFDF